MTRFILLLLALLASGCSRTPSLDQNGDIDLVYRRCLGTGRTTDYLHVSTEFKMAKDLSYGPGQVASWVCRVHPSRKKEFMVQLAAALKRNRVDTIGKNTSSVADASSWSLRIQGADLEVDAVVDQPTDPTNPDAVLAGFATNDHARLRFRSPVACGTLCDKAAGRDHSKGHTAQRGEGGNGHSWHVDCGAAATPAVAMSHL